MIKEHDCVVLTKNVLEEGLETGDVGTVVHIHKDGTAYESRIHDADRPDGCRGHTAGRRGATIEPSRSGARARIANGVISACTADLCGGFGEMTRLISK